jgi:hypothetical protein
VPRLAEVDDRKATVEKQDFTEQVSPARTLRYFAVAKLDDAAVVRAAVMKEAVQGSGQGGIEPDGLTRDDP